MTPRELIELLQLLPKPAMDAQIADGERLNPQYDRGEVWLKDPAEEVDPDWFDDDWAEA